MKKTILLLSFFGCCLVLSSQNQLCVDGSAGSSGNGSASSPYKTIQAAVNAASNGDVIKVAKGTYSEAVKIEQKKVQLLGGFAGSGNFNTADPKTNVTVIKGTNGAPCIYVYIDQVISGSLTISGFTICDGQRGIELVDGWPVGKLSSVMIENNIIEKCGSTDHNGGGIGLQGDKVTIRNNTIRNNKAGRGAGIGRTGDLSDFLIADNLIEKNTGYEGHGGGVSVDGTGTVSGNIFDGNVVDESLTWGYGGAILITNYDTTKVVTLSHNVYRNNRALLNGGAVFVDEAAKVRMDHDLFYNNTCRESGSAVYVDEDWEHHPSVLEMNHCTVSGNSASDGKAAMRVEKSIARVQNCIFWNNGSDFDFLPAGQPISKLTVDYTLTQQGYAGTGNITSNPLFADAPNGDFHLQSTGGRFNPATGQFVSDSQHSPAIDTGNPMSDFSNEPAPNGGRVNMGCYGNTAEASKSGGTGNEDVTQLSWAMFPTPAKESVTIDRLQAGSSVNIFDVTGKNVYSSIVRNAQTIINTANFDNGVYIVQVTCNGAVSVRKLVVSK